MIKVCDAIMGSGKTSAAIAFMNEHPNNHFLYIAPYLAEAKRIKDSCPSLHFIEPNNYSEATHSKIEHTRSLLLEGQNIVSTHQASALYDDSIIELLKEQDYVIFIDEAVDVIYPATNITEEDVKLLVGLGFLEEVSPNIFCRSTKKYSGVCLSDVFRSIGSKKLSVVNIDEELSTETVCYITYPEEFLSLPNDIYILTYLFSNSPMELFILSSRLNYSNIHITRDGSSYRFSSSDTETFVPEYTCRLSEMIQIVDSPKANAVGDSYFALSLNWYATHIEEREQLKKNLYNYFVNMHRGVSSDSNLCATYKRYWRVLKGKGYGQSGCAFNERATNQFANKTILAYPVNIFCSPSIKHYFRKRGQVFSDDAYALSTMVQWIWRSAIRNGTPVELYIPSKRMRELLINWIKTVEMEGKQNAR